MNNVNSQDLAEKIAALLQENHKESGEDFLRASLEKINQRLDKIESQLDFRNSYPKPQSAKPFHASQERFKSLEALADEIIAGFHNEKPCPYEPTAKPCDNCSMCSSRGF